MSYPDEAMTAERANAIIVAAFPQFRGMEVVSLDEGYDFRIFEVEATWLFRFPKREASVAKLHREHQLLPRLHKAVPLPVPTYEFFGQSNERPGWPFAGYDSTQYNHVAPPNWGGQDCGVNHISDTPKEHAIAPPRSEHNGVVVVTFGDGHTELINDDIDLLVWRAMGSRNGEEPYQ